MDALRPYIRSFCGRGTPPVLEIGEPKWPIIAFASPALRSERCVVKGWADPNVFVCLSVCPRIAIVSPTDFLLLSTASGVEVGNNLTRWLGSLARVVVHAPFRLQKLLMPAA
jgi:hypothetical protein